MKLSEAMRAGAKLVPQTTGKLFQYVRDETTDNRTIVAACALGHAYLGIHPEAINDGPYLHVAEQEVNAVWPELLKIAPGHVSLPLGRAIASLNDLHGIPTEEIADQLASVGL